MADSSGKHGSGLESSAGNSHSNSECPICFNRFSSSIIESHAANCTGKSASQGLAEDSIKQGIDDGKIMLPENLPARKSPMSFFMKRPPASNSPSIKRKSVSQEDNRNGSAVKKIKVNGATGNNFSIPCSKEEKSKHLRRPLADEMRPTNFDDYLGQEDVIGPEGNGFWRPIFQSISLPGASAIPSMIFWGPPGCGKTSLANILSAQVSKAQKGQWRFARLSACTAGIAQVKEEVSKAKNERGLFKRSTMLFIDEIHRFNKIQQDALLPHVEDGTITLIGATTENPSFSLNSALLSRCRVIMLLKLAPRAISVILRKALNSRDVQIINEKAIHSESNFMSVSIMSDAVEYLSNVADGDARTALNCLEISLEILRREKEIEMNKSEQNVTKHDLFVNKRTITVADIKLGLKRSHMLYDRKGDEHYHCASALQKSVWGSDDSAALYWLMRMFEGGEDPLFIARRLVRIASEDVGLGDPKALQLAVAAMQGCQLIGRPECDVILAECVVYLARAKKSHEVYSAMNKVKQLIANGNQNPAVPLHLRNPTSSLEQNIGYGAGYSYDLNDVKRIGYMPDELKDERFF